MYLPSSLACSILCFFPQHDITGGNHISNFLCLIRMWHHNSATYNFLSLTARDRGIIWSIFCIVTKLFWQILMGSFSKCCAVSKMHNLAKKLTSVGILLYRESISKLLMQACVHAHMHTYLLCHKERKESWELAKLMSKKPFLGKLKSRKIEEENLTIKNWLILDKRPLCLNWGEIRRLWNL